MNKILNLDKLKFEGITKIIKIPGIEEFSTKDIAKLYGVKYFIHNDFNKIPLVVRVTSKTNSFTQIYGMDIYNQKMEPASGFVFDGKMPIDKFIEFFGEIGATSKVKPLREHLNLKRDNFLQEKYNTPLDEFMIPGLGDTKGMPPEVKIFGGVYGFLIALNVMWKYRYYFTKFKNWLYERYVSGPLEQEINDKLFNSQKKEEPAFKMYYGLIEFIKYTTREKSPAFMICGPPGTSKTYIVRRTLHFEGLKPRKDYSIEKGAALDLSDVFALLYYNKDRILILDDFDTPLRNENTVNLLKSITDSYGKRIVSMPTERKLDTVETGGNVSAVPQKFEFRGKILIITNLARKDIDTALLSRIPVYEVRYSMTEIIDNIKKMLHYINPEVSDEIKMEVYNYILELYSKDKHINLDFRTFKTSVDVRIGNPLSWKEMVKIIVNYRG